MGHKVKVAGEKESDVHYENCVVHKERECNQQTTHRVGKTGSIRSRSRSHVSGRVHSDAPSYDGNGGREEAMAARRSPGHSHASSKQRSRCSSGGGGGGAGTNSGGGKCAGASDDASKCGRKSASGAKGDRSATARSQRCYDLPARRRPQPCTRPAKWQTGKYVRDECGSGIVPKRLDFPPNRKIWCKTPLSMYQATIGELGRKLLCREAKMTRDVKPEPPCNIEEYIMPLCRGYYRKYDCMRPCEEEYVTHKQGKKVYRDRVERYWEPCLIKEQKHHLDINTYAHHNAALGLKVRRLNDDIPCW